MFTCTLAILTCYLSCVNGSVSYGKKLGPVECRQMEIKIEQEKRRQELKDMIRLEELKKENKK